MLPKDFTPEVIDDSTRVKPLGSPTEIPEPDSPQLPASPPFRPIPSRRPRQLCRRPFRLRIRQPRRQLREDDGKTARESQKEMPENHLPDKKSVLSGHGRLSITRVKR